MGFGDFETICHKCPLPVCAVIGPPSAISGGPTGIQADCYARSVELANTVIFEAAADFMHILALGMTAIMILHVRSKFTAVGEFEKTQACMAFNFNDFNMQVEKRSPPSSTYTWPSA